MHDRLIARVTVTCPHLLDRKPTTSFLFESILYQLYQVFCTCMQANFAKSEEYLMASILINDLNESKDMDRQAMRAVVGGCASAHFNYPSPPYRSLLQKNNTNPLSDWVNSDSQLQNDI